MRLIFLGAPGAGKGTQASRLVQRLGITHVSTGDMLREMIRENTPLAKELRGYLDSGQLVPDEKMNEAVSARLEKSDVSGGFILDGYPRTIAQAEALEESLAGKGLGLDHVLFFNLPEETAVERLSGRRTCRNCGANFHVKFKPPGSKGTCESCGGELYQRDDDNPEVIKRRFEEFQRKTADLVGFYREKGQLREIDASPGPDEIYSRVLEALSLAD